MATTRPAHTNILKVPGDVGGWLWRASAAAAAGPVPGKGWVYTREAVLRTSQDATVYMNYCAHYVGKGYTLERYVQSHRPGRKPGERGANL